MTAEFCQAQETQVSQNVVVPSYIKKLVLARPLTDEERQRGFEAVQNFRRCLGLSSHKGASTRKKVRAHASPGAATLDDVAPQRLAAFGVPAAPGGYE